MDAETEARKNAAARKLVDAIANYCTYYCSYQTYKTNAKSESMLAAARHAYGHACVICDSYPEGTVSHRAWGKIVNRWSKTIDGIEFAMDPQHAAADHKALAAARSALKPAAAPTNATANAEEKTTASTNGKAPANANHPSTRLQREAKAKASAARFKRN